MLLIVGAGFTGWPVMMATIAEAAILAWLFAMLADLGIAEAESVESPRTCTPGTATDSAVCQFTAHQRLLAVTSFACCAMSPARCGGTTFSTSPLKESNSVLTVMLFTSTSFASWFGRYSMIAL